MNTRVVLCFVLQIALLLLASPPTRALTTRCAGNAGELDAALTEWTTQAVDADPRFVIQLQAGVHALPSSNASGVYQYSSTTPVSLEILGGFDAGCVDRSLDARNTVIDGGGFANSRLHLFNVDRDALIEGITFTGLSDGVQIIQRLENPANGHHFRVSHVRILGNAASSNSYTFRLWGFGNSSGAEVMLDNSLIADNFTANATPILLSTGNNGRIVVSASTITGNSVSPMAAALTLQHWNGVSGLEIVYDSSIAWNNGSGALDLDVANAPSPPTIAYGLVGQLRGSLAPCSTLLDVDPQFVDPTLGDYRLGTDSPALEAGNPAPADGLSPVDLFGRPRVQDGAPDLGALEGAFQTAIFRDGFETP